MCEVKPDEGLFLLITEDPLFAHEKGLHALHGQGFRFQLAS